MATAAPAHASGINASRLFLMSCIALAVTSMTFSIRAGILNDLSGSFNLTGSELGWITGMAFLGFPVAMMIGGLIYNQVGAKNLMIVAFIGHLLGIVLTIFAGGFWLLAISTFCIGFANGAVEAACNPLIADEYADNKTTMLNKFHVWFPGGIVIGAVITYYFGAMLGWQGLLATMLVPLAIYGVMIFTTKFPETRSGLASTAGNIKALFSPLFIGMCLLMTLTATTELGTTQWIDQILAGTGAHPMLVLALIFGVMAVGRFFAGPIVHRLNPVGVLLCSAVVTTAGLYLLSQASGGMTYFAAFVFALGVCYFWPTMIGVIGEYKPDTGALGLSLVGGAGMFGVSIWQPIIGGWIEAAQKSAEATGVTGDAASLVAGQAVLERLSILPVILIVAFAILLALRLKRPEEQAPSANQASGAAS